ncbi:putative uncharacterized protein DDB_G0282129 isoform X3 [Cotesia glomerata]|uniref:putative uncharacterized protein DDB_G0282129 isoform X3 n=1 Tax=Cotesia glomerata TaxID=32391 RepID=UPI001D021EBD|nr:putative uncharacterized protein DDB_G0282129 isoform X3 [Cotesia glomerata]
MTPGVNDGPKNTGTLPKSNRRYERNREIINSNQPSARTVYQSRTQHSNNLLDLQPVGNDRDICTLRSTKNSNTRSISSTASLSYQDIADIVSLGGNRQYNNYTGEDCIQWQEMSQSVDSRAQSPPHTQPAKPMNVDKMPDRNQVESRLNQIRDYIRMTSTMMESLSLSSDPRAHTQHDKLVTMVEDLRDSERKLTKLLEEYRPIEEQNGEGADGEESLESQLRRKMEASQRKLAELQEHQANLVGMQQQVRERLQEARQTQQALLLQENQALTGSSTPAWDNGNSQRQLANDAEILESETSALRGKLAALQNKKKQMDLLVAELQNVEMSDRASCSSGGSRNAERDKSVELETLKQQLAHLKNLMSEATRARDAYNAINQPEVDSNPNDACCNENGQADDEAAAALSSSNSIDRNSEADDISAKFNNSKERLTVEQIQAVTRELKEQQLLLQAARAEIKRLKDSTLASTSSGPPILSHGSISPPSMAGYLVDKKSSNNNNNNNNNNNSNQNNIHEEISQSKKRQLEEFVRKEQCLTASVNRDGAATDWSSRRGSNSQHSHTSTPAHIWHNSTTIDEANDQNGDNITAPDNLLDIGPQITAVDGLGNNWWNVPAPSVNPQQHVGTGSLEYYRQLLMSSQAQQLQMMSTTMQQCCQLLWAQQRELQAMRSSIVQIQQHLQINQNQNQSQIQPQSRVSNETRDNYSNLSRSTHHLGNVLDAALPPSSSLPNLVSLPTPSPAPSHNSIVTSANSHHQHHHHHNHQQLNNQVPPGNRANNYYDNFRSYSRQNLLSGNSKSVTDSLPGTSGNSSTVTAVHAAHVRNKRNREHGVDNISLNSLSSTETPYSLNLQLSSNLQIHDRETPATRNNNSYNDVATQPVDNFWDDGHLSFRSVPDSNEENYSLRHLSGEMRDVLLSLVTSNRTRPDYLVIILREIKAISEDHRLRPRLLRSLRALQDTQSANNPLNETTDQTASESCQSSDEDSDAGGQARPLLNTSNNDHQSSLLNEFLMSSHAVGQVPHAQNMPALLVDHFEFEAAAQINETNTFPPPILTPGYNEDLAEADQSRPEASNNQQNSPENENVEIQENGAVHSANLDIATLEADREIANLI